MRARAVIAVSLTVGALAAAALVACTDVFHGTDDILNECELASERDASIEACAPDASAPDADAAPEAPPPFALCLDDASAALARAQTACKWLGACETPVGNNRFAECMVHALESYDCAIAKNRTPKGPTRELWTCLAQANDCAAVDKCTFPSFGDICTDDGGTFTVCGRFNPSVRALCNNTVLTRGEPCAASGRTCVSVNGPAFCLGESDGSACVPGCVGSSLRDCDEAGVNVGVECADYGAQRCTSVANFAACAAELGGTCTPLANLSCTNGVATGCPSGILETVDCRRLTVDGGATSCDVNAPGPAWDVSRACFNTASSTPCSATPDSCSGNTLTSCTRGVTYTTTCDAPFVGCSTSPPTFDGAYARCTIAGR